MTRFEFRCANERCGHPASVHGGCFTSACQVSHCFCSGFEKIGLKEDEMEDVITEDRSDDVNVRLHDFLFGKDKS